MVKEKDRGKRILKEVFPVTKRFIYIHTYTNIHGNTYMKT